MIFSNIIQKSTGLNGQFCFGDCALQSIATSTNAGERGFIMNLTDTQKSRLLYGLMSISEAAPLMRDEECNQLLGALIDFSEAVSTLLGVHRKMYPTNAESLTAVTDAEDKAKVAIHNLYLETERLREKLIATNNGRKLAV